MPLVASSKPNRSFVPSPQQSEFLRALADDESHILLEARAGSGKSTTCREGAWALPTDQRSVYCCFNAHVAQEFQRDLPSSCQAATMHSLGLRIVKQALGEVQVDQDKVDRLAEPFFPERYQRPERRAVSRLVNLCRDLLADPEPATLAELAVMYDIDLPRWGRDDILAVVPEVLTKCQEQTGAVDFGDMIWLPVVMELALPRPADVLFVDEAQDLNHCQQHLMSRICPDGRVIVVGDRNQAIYAFRGADHDSIPRLQEGLARSPRGIESYPLTVTRRCPRLHVEMARKIVPDLDHLPTAPDGSIEQIKPASVVEHVEPGDMILCRTNVPLVGLCYRFLQSGVRAFVRGRDIGKGLQTLILRLRPTGVGDLQRKLLDYRATEGAKTAELRNPEPVIQQINDRVDCLATLCQGAATVDEVKARIDAMFSDLTEDGAVLLSSIHRAKGLERDTIVIVRPDLLPGPWAVRPEDLTQERNLMYVAVTRARQRLIFAGEIPALLQ
jgi:DNA helicase II / ATP-dependent DNA helicase PcrA